MMRVAVRLAVALILACPAISPPVRAQEVVFLVRHAERPASNADSISEAGTARAEALARLLRHVGITAIFTSEALRTVETARPLAQDLELETVRIGGATAETQVRNTLDRLEGLGPDDRALVVGHSNTVPLLLTGLGHSRPVTIGEDEHDALFVVFPRNDGPPTVVLMRY